MMKKSVLYMLSLFLLLGTTAEALIGIYIPGYGTKSLGLGGAVTANPQDAITSSANPAGMSWIPDQANLDIVVLTPIRGYSYSNFDARHLRSKRNFFPVPAIGWKTSINECLTAGISFWGNGGMNTTYGHNNPVFGRGTLGIDFSQALLAPTLSYTPFCGHSFGICPLLGMQALSMSGLQNFKAFSYDPEHVTNKGHYYAYGIGARIGWLGELREDLWFGISYSTRIAFSKFRHYQGVMASGRADTPAQLMLGLRFKPLPCFTISVDAEKVFFSQIPPFGNKISQLLVKGHPLGKSNGPGFGWKDIWSYKAGLSYEGFDRWVLRAGYCYSKTPFSRSQIDFNILAPSVCEHHFTAGASWCCCNNQELSFAFMYGTRGHLRGISNFGLGEVNLWYYQLAWEFGYTWYF